MDDATSSDDAEESKPAPDIIEAALKRAKAAPAEAIMIGDTPYDIEAARRAGVKTIAFRSGGWSDADLEGAIEIYDGPGTAAKLASSALGRHRRYCWRMPKKNGLSVKPQTHFEQVPLEVVVKVATIDPPLELTPSLVEPVVSPSPPKPIRRSKE